MKANRSVTPNEVALCKPLKATLMLKIISEMALVTGTELNLTIYLVKLIIFVADLKQT